MQELNNPKNWKKTHKKSYKVWICRPATGTQCTNVLEGANYVTDQNKQFIISGTVGETWVIDAGKLAKTYTFDDGTPITPDTLKSKLNRSGQIDWTKLQTKQDGMAINYAFHLPLSIKNFPVQTSWGDTLLANRDGIRHGKGDFLVCADNGGQPNLSDVWVVNGEVFPSTYDLHAFPNMFDSATAAGDPARPTKSFIQATDNKAKVIAKQIAQACVSSGIKIYGGLTHEDELEKEDYFQGFSVYSFNLNKDPDADTSQVHVLASPDGGKLKLWIEIDASDYGTYDVHNIPEAVALIKKAASTMQQDLDIPAIKNKLMNTFNKVKGTYGLESMQFTDNLEDDIPLRIDVCTPEGYDGPALFADLYNNGTVSVCAMEMPDDNEYEIETTVDKITGIFKWWGSLLSNDSSASPSHTESILKYAKTVESAIAKVKDKIGVSKIDVETDYSKWAIYIYSKTSDNFVILESPEGTNGSTFQIVLMDGGANQVGSGKNSRYNVSSDGVKQAIIETRGYLCS
jgi:hypothetical protein